MTQRVPWWLKLPAAILVLVLAVLAALMIYESGRGWVGVGVDTLKAELAQAHSELSAREVELAAARQQVDAAHSALQIEKASQEQLAARIRTLEAENARLREDVLVFESLAGGAHVGIEPGFKINRLVVEPDSAPGRFRYRMLILRQGGRADVEVRGSYQLLATIDRNGQGATIQYPAEANPSTARIAFRHFQRVEGVFQLPAGSRLVSIEARFLQEGQIRAKASASL